MDGHGTNIVVAVRRSPNKSPFRYDFITVFSFLSSVHFAIIPHPLPLTSIRTQKIITQRITSIELYHPIEPMADEGSMSDEEPVVDDSLLVRSLSSSLCTLSLEELSSQELISLKKRRR